MREEQPLILARQMLWALGSLCKFYRIPFSPDLILQQFPPPYTLATLQQVSEAVGLKVGHKQICAGQLHKIVTPCLAVLNPVPELGAPSAGAATDEDPDRADTDQIAKFPQQVSPLAIVLNAEPDLILFYEQGSDTPQTLSTNEFAARFSGSVFLFVPQPAKGVDETVEPEQRHFSFGWFVPELLRYRSVWRDVLLASLVLQLMGLATPLFTQVVIDKVVVHHTMHTLAVIAVGQIIFTVFTAVVSWVRQYLVLHTGNRVDAVLGSRVFDHLLGLPMRYFEHRATGVLTARMQGIDTIREFVTGAAATALLDLPFMLVFLAIMFYYSVTLTLITLGLIGVTMLISVLVAPKLRERINQQFLLGARNQAFLTEYISGMATVKSLQMEPQVRNCYESYLAQYLHATFSTRQLFNSYNTAANALDQLTTLLILVVGAWTVMTRPEFTIGMLVAFQMFAARVSQPLLRLVGLWQQFQQSSIAVRRLGDVMNTPQEPHSVVPNRENKGQGRIDLEDISFRYREDLPYVYRHLNLSVLPGECVALTGPSGCGKSTLAKLLQAFYFPEEGHVLIDGRNILHMSFNALRQHFGVVPQETILFSGTLYDNLIMANPHASFEQIVRAARMAEIHDTIERLPDGYQTKVGERGVGLSGGQKQRIAIARALLKQPGILIFDEATSGLDADTAAHFAQTINHLKGKVTMLFISHQLPKSLKVDRVFTLGRQGAPLHAAPDPVGGGKTPQENQEVKDQ